jgi:hypothetical protein
LSFFGQNSTHDQSTIDLLAWELMRQFSFLVNSFLVWNFRPILLLCLHESGCMSELISQQIDIDESRAGTWLGGINVIFLKH